MMTISFKGLGSTTRGKILTQISCLTMIWIVWRKIVFLIHILKVYNPKNIYSNKKKIRKELKTTLLKIPTNQGLDTRIYTAGYSHSYTHTHRAIYYSSIHNCISFTVVHYNYNNLQHSPSSW